MTKPAHKDFYWYHRVDLGAGEITDGDYDISDFIHHYQFPDRMDGLAVLDVGRGSGGFAFEFERRGARVTATDLPSFFDWDFVGGDPIKEKRMAAIDNRELFTSQHLTGAFDFARHALKSKVESKLINVYDMSPSAFDGRQFDLVFAGSLLSHLRDPVRALHRLKSLTSRTCIVAAPCFDMSEVSHLPMMILVTGDADRRSWWVMNACGLVQILLAAGFATANIVSRFTLISRRRPDLAIEHLVAHARV